MSITLVDSLLIARAPYGHLTGVRLVDRWLTARHTIAHEQAKLHAETQFEEYRITQDRLFESDFDRFIELEATQKKLEGKG